jgi:predicted small lipoprotein YifL
VRPALRRATVLLALLSLSACGGKQGPVAVTVPSAAVVGDACAHLAAALPTTLDGRARRTTKPVSARVTAWGSPAVILRCGVAKVSTDAGTHVTADGVSWLTAGPTKGLVIWTTVDRTTSLELSVPASIDDQENLLGDLAPAVSGSLSRVPAPASATASGSASGPASPSAPTVPVPTASTG